MKRLVSFVAWIGVAVTMWMFVGCAQPTPETKGPSASPMGASASPSATASPMGASASPTGGQPMGSPSVKPEASPSGGATTKGATGTPAKPTGAQSGAPGAAATVAPNGEPLPGLADWKGKKNPVASNPQTLAQGKDIFLKNCAPCHGDAGKGDGPQGLALDPKPRDLTNPSQIQFGTEDWQIFRTAWEGIPGTGMAPWKGRLPDKDVWSVVHYVKGMSGAK